MNQTSTSRLLRKSVATLVPLLALTAPLSAAVVYWDTNGVTPGAGAAPAGTWDDAGLNWNTDPGGEGAGPAAWSSGDTAVFSAGTDAVGEFTITISGNKTVAGLNIEEGTVNLAGSAVVVGTGTVSVTNNATLSINSSARLSTTAGAKVFLNGGTLRQTNPGNAGSFIANSATLEIGPLGGTVNYTSSDTGLVSIYTGTITGSGTLTKTGPHEFRYQGLGLPNSTYTKLVVNEGLFRLGFLSPTQDERGFGAVPAAFTPDAITLNGGSIGTSFNATLHANRGVTLGVSGGTFNTGGGGMTIPGGVTGPGGLTKVGPSMASPLTLSGPSTYLGVTTVNQGVLQFAKQVALYNNTPAAWTEANIIVASGAALGVHVGGTGEFTVADVDLLKSLGSATGGFGNGSFLSLDTTNAAGGTFTYDSVIANTNGGANVLGFSKTGAGTLVLGGANTYTGTTTVRGGTLTLSATGSIADTSPLTVVGNSAIFDLGANRNEIVGTVTLQTSGRINGTGTSTLIVSAGTFEMQSGTVNANLAGSVPMNKTGTGTVTIAGSSIHTGETLITGGILHITGSLNGTSNVSVAQTVTPTATIPGVLSGSGSINVAAGGDITIFPGGKLAPGTASVPTNTPPTIGTVGTLSLNPLTAAIVNISGGVDAIGSQALVFELDTVAASDRVNLGTGGLVIGTGVLELDDFLFTPLAGFSSGGIRDFVLFDGSLPISGSLGANVTGTLGGFDVTLQLGDGGNDIILHVVPEPGSAAFLIGGLALLARRRRDDRA